MSNKDTLGHTIKVVVGVSLVCSIVVSLAAVGLRPLQVKNKEEDTQRNILAVSGVDYLGKKQADVYNNAISVKLVDLNSGEYVPEDKIDVLSYDQRLAAKDPAMSIALDPSDNAGILRRANYAPVYLVKDDAGNISRYILPVHGRGLWSTMYAFVALKADGNTVEALTYYEQGETPGLGGEIQNPKWTSVWQGKKLYKDGQIALHVVKAQAAVDAPSDVDGLSGATLTANGVQNTFNFWLGEKGFGPFLRKIQNASMQPGSTPEQTAIQASMSEEG